LQLGKLANCFSDIVIAQWHELFKSNAHSEIKAIVVGKLQQVEESILSLTLALELEVEPLDEDEAVPHDGGQVGVNLLLVLQRNGRNGKLLDELNNLVVDS